MGQAGPGWDATTDEGDIPLSYTGPQWTPMMLLAGHEQDFDEVHSTHLDVNMTHLRQCV